MLTPLSSRSRKKTLSTAAGDRIYAIGDIHGRYDLLQELVRRIEQHSGNLPPPKALHIIVLGDVIDRGPDSAKVIEFLYDWAKHTSGPIMLLGNHDDVMLRVYDGEAPLLRQWLRVGGAETLRSFGLEPPARDDDPKVFIEAMRRAIPPAWIDWMRSWPLSARSGDYYFCHAGIRPGVALKRQARTDLLWIREEFLGFRGDYGAAIVHGHSISPSVDMQDNRIGIDTGAYRTGILTALYVEGTERGILSTDAEPSVDSAAEPASTDADRQAALS